MKKYKTYLETSSEGVPRRTTHRHSKCSSSNKENSTRSSYKQFVTNSNYEVPRTSSYRKRKILKSVAVGRNEGEIILADNTNFQQPSKRSKRTTQEEQVENAVPQDVIMQLPLTLDQTILPNEPDNHRNTLHCQIFTDGEKTVENCGQRASKNLIHDEQSDVDGFGDASLSDNIFEEQEDGALETSTNQTDISKVSATEIEDDLLYPGASVTKGQTFLLLMAYILRHSLTGIALEHLLKMFNELFPGSLPATSYLFHKAYGEYGHYEAHFYCSECTDYIGKGDGVAECSVCQTPFDRDTSLRNGSYFLVLSLTSQLKDILENPQISFAKSSCEMAVTDIPSGREYQRLVQSGDMSKDDISLIWNCDGIPVFRSSKCQLWPVQCQIIELKPTERKNNICMPCIWFGEKKPNIMTLLTPFVEELQVLETSGLKWTDINNQTHCSKVFALVCSSDSVARPQIRNTKQFNGQYGCDFCYHKGAGAYTYINPEPLLRTESEHYQHAMAASPSNPVMGVKGPSPLMRLQHFQMINGFVPEYQHSVCLGVTRQLMALWLDSKNHEKPWYIGTKTDIIDKNLLAIKPPTELTRVPRSVKDRKFWKASEWRSFLLFYALPVLSGLLSKKYWTHLFLLVFGIFNLLQDKVQHVQINQAETALKNFVKGFEKLYGKENMTFNVHLMTHISTSVRNWGPLWATSTFSFESFNGVLLKFFNGTTHVDGQIVKRFLKWRDITKKADKYMANAQEGVKELFNSLHHSCLQTAKSMHLSDSVRAFGHPRIVNLLLRHSLAIEKLLGYRVKSGRYFERFIVDGVLYHSHQNARLQKRHNCIVELSDGTFCKIIGLVAFEHLSSPIFCVLVKKLHPSGKCLCRDPDLKITSWFIHEVTEVNTVHAVYAHDLKKKCVMINFKEKNLVTPLPNNIERD